MATLVSAQTLWSCGLACIESILADNGVAKTQSQMLAELAHEFPQWGAQPGILNGGEFGKVFKGAGLDVCVIMPSTFAESIKLMQDVDVMGAILATSRFWETPARQKLIELNHALRLVSADGNGVTLMNPYRAPTQGRIELFSWQDIDAFKTQPFVFKRLIPAALTP
jgi:hypothetical protein